MCAWTRGSRRPYLAAFYPSVILEEASFLRQTFPEEYGLWSRDVPLFLPRLNPAGPRATAFSWSRVAANKEWRTALAIPAVLALLWARASLR